MKAAFLSLFVAVTAIAAPAEKAQCYQKTVTVCPYKKPKPKPAPEPTVITKEVVKEVQVPVEVEVVREVLVLPAPEPESPFRFTLHGALGVGVKSAGDGWGSVSGMVGLRFQHRPSQLGAEAYTALDKGLGLEAMVWTYQGKSLSHHIDAGVLFTGGAFNAISVNDVPRRLDISVGTGLEIPVTKKLDLTLDWKLRLPNPVYVAKHDSPVYDADGNQVYGPEGKYLDVKHVIGNSLAQSQVFFGVLYRL